MFNIQNNYPFRNGFSTMKKYILFFVVFLLFISTIWFYFRLDKLFIDQQINEKSPEIDLVEKRIQHNSLF
ncbi:hypothetical protein NT98_5747 (plasmid) [Bacillus cereus]|nr:hypothetical protein NT98_5747 [Bacillus cereus]AJI07954.1 hypothetical protein AQ16_5421 [Bacillus cereus G9241]